MTNIFAAAKVIEAPKPKKAKKDEKEEVVLDGLEDYSVIISVIKNLEAVAKTMESDLKEQMKSHFSKAEKKPDNFRGVEGDAKASCEMRKRSSASTLTDEEVTLLTKLGVPFDVVPVVEERFIVNPAYSADQDLLKKVSDALSKVKELPADFIMLQKGSSKSVTNDDTIPVAYEKKVFASIMDSIAVFAIKPTVSEFELDKQVDKVRKILGLEQKKVVK